LSKHYIKSVSIWGLWAHSEAISFDLSQQFNFIIGRNGTGKTTVINLIAAALLADFDKLDKINFTRIVIQLGAFAGRKKPSIEVLKEQKPNLPYWDITYKIKLSSSETATFDLDAFAEERAYRGVPARLLRDRHTKEKFLFVQRQLEELVDVSWLSVYRASEERDRTDDKRFASAVDQKLATLSIEIVKYFAKLSQAFAQKTQEFQQASFLSLTKVEKSTDLQSQIRKLDVSSERAALAAIFELLGVDRNDYEPQLAENSARFARAKERFERNDPIPIGELFLILNAIRAHSLVQLYETLEARRSEIFRPRDSFLSVLNSLLAPRKRVYQTATNELAIESKDGKTLRLEELSSGEKQLIIILGQALLQESVGAIYIADEPELSLHVEWQERITSSIEQLNPNAQIIFATHSPDIVGSHADRIIDMERIVQ